MDNLLDISKGLHQDFHPISQPTGTYTYLLNAIRLLSGGLENEKGTNLVSFLDKIVIGGFILDTDIILFLVNGVNSEIGSIDVTDTYTSITTHSDLNFQLSHKVDATGKKNAKGDRIIYFVDGYNPNRTINLDDTSLLNSTSFGDNIKLQVTPEALVIELDSVVDGGSLPTGIYQATARLLTRSTNSVPFSLLSPIVSIVDEPSTTTLVEIDGAPPQSPSSKAIKFKISNIDTTYSFIEIAILTYIGTANVSSFTIVGRLPIDGRDTITFTYSSLEQNKESLDTSALVVNPVVYDSATSIEQKDNILVLSNLTSTTESFDFQPFANAIKLKYFIEEIPLESGYKNVLTNALKRSYRRGEVYSFGIAPSFKTSYNTTAFHIPGKLYSLAFLNNKQQQGADPVNKDLGAYASTSLYPEDKGYPDTPNGRIIHHVMPTISQEPIIVKRNGQTFIRVLGVEADFTEAISFIPENIRKNINGFNLVRQVRTDANKSILSQGIAQGHALNTSGGAINNQTNNLYLTPLAGNNTKTNRFTNIPVDYIADEIGFFSPESVIYQKSFSNAQFIEPVMKLTGTQTIVADKRTLPDNEGQTGRFVAAFLDYDNMAVFPSVTPIRSVIGATIQYIPESAADAKPENTAIIPVGNSSRLVNNFHSNGYLYMKLGGELPVNTTIVSGKPEFYYEDKSNATDLLYLNGVDMDKGGRTSTSTRNLYNLVRVVPNQYGEVFDASYMICGSWKLEENASKRFFGGDTFLTKFAVVSMTSNATNYRDRIDYKTLNYFFVESEINTELRHYISAKGTEGQEGYVAGTVPYYPKYTSIWEVGENKAPGILNLSFALGHARGYNRQYSFENTVIGYYPKQLAEEVITTFSNRSIYSEQAAEGEQLDSFRVFLPNNYHDIPRDRGPIIDTFVHQNRFYQHTTGALFESFFNEKVTQASSLGEVYLGTGGVFDRPSAPIQTIDGGYAGTQGKWGISTPFGYFFVDARQKKIFLLAQQLQDLASQGLESFFNRMSESDDFRIGYDYLNERLLLSSSQNWTVSYQTELKSWTAFHSYLPYFILSRAKDIYFAYETSFYKHNVGNYGEFFGTYYPTILEYVNNIEAKTTKSVDNLVIHSNTYRYDRALRQPINQPYETFTNLRVYNEFKDSSTVSLITPKTFEEEWAINLKYNELFCKQKNQEFRLTVPKDLLLDPSIPEVYVETKEFRPRITGKWAKFKWTFNRPDRYFVLHTIDSLIRGIAR